MPSPEDQELITYINELIRATHDSLMDWKAANPTTYYWDKSMDSETPNFTARLQIQRVEQNIQSVVDGKTTVSKQHYYILQAFEFRPGANNAKLTAMSQGDPTLDEKLSQLYEAIRTGVARKGLDFLKAVIPGIRA